MILLVMGISGSGKTTVGKLLAARLRIPFYDADDFHPPQNVEKMRRGTPLDDTDREPWLEAMAARMPAWERTGGAVLACSALKHAYREVLKSTGVPVQLIFLEGSARLIHERTRVREGHFFPASLVESQLQVLERPGDAITIDISDSPEAIVERIYHLLHKNSVVKDERVTGDSE